MAQFEAFEKFLEPDYHPDYWSDNAVILAGEMIAKFTPEDWDKASISWSKHSSGWQSRFADSLDSAPHDRAFPILSQMLLSKEDIVAKSAANSLRDLAAQGNKEKLSKECVNRLKQLSTESRVWALALDGLIKLNESPPPAENQ